jgi:hypothetical protein
LQSSLKQEVVAMPMHDWIRVEAWDLSRLPPRVDFRDRSVTESRAAATGPDADDRLDELLVV